MLGLLFTAVMLFPLYWMINVSFTERSAIRNGDLFPRSFTLDSYREALGDQLPYLGTSLIVSLGTVVVTLVVAAPAAYALAHLFVPARRSMRFGLIVAQMVPAVVMALGFYQLYSDLGILDTIPGLILANSTLAVPFGVMVLEAFMLGIPRELLQAAEVDGAVVLAHVLVDRAAHLPQRRGERRALRVPVGLVGLPVRLHPQSRRREPAPDHDGDLRLHRLPEPGVGTDDGHRRAGLHPDRPAHRRCPTLRIGRCHRRRGEGLKP